MAATAKSAAGSSAATIVFDSAFESGNLAEARLVSDAPLEYDLHIRPDTLNERHRIWFFFTARCTRPATRALLHIVGYSKTKSLYREGMAPIVSSGSGWERMPPGSAYLYRSPRHGQKYVLSFPFTFDSPATTYSFAYCYPYTYSYLQRFLHTLDAKGLPCYRRSLLTRTVQHRRLDLLTISSPVNLAIDEAHARELAKGGGDVGGSAAATAAPALVYLFVSARVHPGESPASFLMHGLLRFLLSDDPAARAIREVAVLKVVPMLNPDGVFLGNYRCNSLGLDLNRMWSAPTPWGAPTIEAVRRLAQAYTRRPGCDVRVFLDIHAHSTCMSGFVYANVPNEPRRMEQVAAFPRALGSHYKDLSFDRTKFCSDPTKSGTGRRAMGTMLPTVHCYTLEVSLFCAAGGGVGRGEAYSPSSYVEMGQAAGLALSDIAAPPPFGRPGPSGRPSVCQAVASALDALSIAGCGNAPRASTGGPGPGGLFCGATDADAASGSRSGRAARGLVTGSGPATASTGAAGLLSPQTL